MAIKDLNNKKTGDKLYANEWNDVMNEILTHFKNKRIHQDMIITSDDELVYTDENNIRHQYVLQAKTGITYGELIINSVNSTSLVNNIYTYSNISNNGADISFQISYKREILEDGEHRDWQTTGARIIIDGNLPEGLELLTSDTNDSIKVRVSENQNFSTKEYQFRIKVSMVETSSEEDEDNTKVFITYLSQNAAESNIPDLIYGQIPINGDTLDGLLDETISYNTLKNEIQTDNTKQKNNNNSFGFVEMTTTPDESYTVLYYLIKDNTKELWWWNNGQPRTTNEIISKADFVGEGKNYNKDMTYDYLNTTYKLYMLACNKITQSESIEMYLK